MSIHNDRDGERFPKTLKKKTFPATIQSSSRPRSSESVST